MWMYFIIQYRNKCLSILSKNFLNNFFGRWEYYFLCVKKEPTNLRLLTRSSALRLMWLSLWWYVAQFERSFLTQQIWFSSYLLSEQEFPIYSLCQRKKTMRNSDIAQHNASFTATHGRSGYLFAPHVLRHTKAFRLLETGINAFYIRNLLRR